MDKVTCPYCGKEFEVNPEIYEYDNSADDVTEQQQCPECEKFVNITRSVIIQYEADVCPCQMENHDWELSKTSPPCMSVMRCIHCGTERNLTDAERREYNIPTHKEYLKYLDAFEK